MIINVLFLMCNIFVLAMWHFEHICREQFREMQRKSVTGSKEINRDRIFEVL